MGDKVHPFIRGPVRSPPSSVLPAQLQAEDKRRLRSVQTNSGRVSGSPSPPAWAWTWTWAPSQALVSQGSPLPSQDACLFDPASDQIFT